MPPVSVLIKPASGLCNMRCDYCFYCDETKHRTQENYGFMTEATLKNVVRRTMLQADGMITYAFQGGEPTLRGLDFYRKLLEFQQQYNKKKLPVQNVIQTNGYAIDESWCQFFRDNHFLVGVSVDGLQSIHDRYRHGRQGEPSYGRILAVTRLMDQYRVDYNILTVVTREIAEQIEDIYRNYQQQGWKYLQFIPCLDPLDAVHGEKKEEAASHALTPMAYGDFLVRLFRLWHADVHKGCHPYIRQFENYIGMLMGYHPEACDQSGTCGIQYVVEADGSVYPCDFYMLDPYCLGNFNQDRVPAIDQRRAELLFVERSLQLTADCRACRHYFICRGGCQRQRDLIPGTKLYENYFCQSFQTFFDACLEPMQEIARNSRKT